MHDLIAAAPNPPPLHPSTPPHPAPKIPLILNFHPTLPIPPTLVFFETPKSLKPETGNVQVREAYWKVYNNLYIGSQDAMIPAFPLLDVLP